VLNKTRTTPARHCGITASDEKGRTIYFITRRKIIDAAGGVTLILNLFISYEECPSEGSWEWFEQQFEFEAPVD
jgi:hypothetical protein